MLAVPGRDEEAAAGRILSLPMYPELSDAQIDYVADAARDALER